MYPVKKWLFILECSDVRFQLTHLLMKRLEENGLISYFKKIELPFIKVLTEMEYSGTYVDSKLLKKMSREIGQN